MPLGEMEPERSVTMGGLTFKRIDFDSQEFRDACHLRNAVLRVPLGLSVFDEDLEKERDQLHYGLYDHTARLIACVIVVSETSTIARLRQMAVSSAHRARGHGSSLLRFVEDQIRKAGFREIHLHARSTAAGFYRKMGYEELGPVFIEVGIPHVMMIKHLNEATDEPR